MQIGGLLIGLLGDKIGRKRATLYAVCGMTVATVGQGCLPSRKTGGQLSQVVGMCMLFVCRSIQVRRPPDTWRCRRSALPPLTLRAASHRGCVRAVRRGG
jgi:hypothetical protein